MQTSVSWREVVSFMSSLLCSCRVCGHSASCDGSMLGREGLLAQLGAAQKVSPLNQLQYRAIRSSECEESSTMFQESYM